MTFFVKLMNMGNVHVKVVYEGDDDNAQVIRPGDNAELLAESDDVSMAVSTFKPEPPSGLPPVLTSLTGSASIDGSPADGTSTNAATFVAMDQYGAPVAGVPLDVTTSAGDISAATVTTGDDGSATINVTSTVVGSVTVTAVTQTLRADVTMTFIEVGATRSSRKRSSS